MLRPATIEDLGLVARICADGFADDPVMHWLLDDETFTERLSLTFTGLALSFLGPDSTLLVLADGAAALWREPSFDHHAPDPEPDPDEPPSPFTEAELERLAVLRASMGAAHPAEPHWYLNVVSTMPDRQGRGLGTAILAPTLAKADDEGVPCYLESSNPRNRSLYRRLGFVEAADSILPDGLPSLAPMWREPRSI